MAVKYLRSAAAGTGTGADWTNAYTTLVAALAGVAAGDTIYVADDHAETQAANMTLTSPGTAANPVRVICVNTHTVTPPTATATSATISTTLGTILNIAGYAYYYGVTFNCSSGASGNNMTVGGSPAMFGLVFDHCVLAIPATGAGNAIVFGNTTVPGGRTELINTQVSMGSVSNFISMVGGRVIWRDTPSALQGVGAAMTTLFKANTLNSGEAIVSGVDLSAMGTGKSLVLVSTAAATTWRFRNCRLGASVSVISGAISSQGAIEVYLENCDSGSTNYRMEHYKYQGFIKNDMTHVRAAGGATDGTTTISHTLATLAGSTLFSPLEGPWIREWNETVGSAITVTVELCTENVTLTNGDAYLEVEYLGDSGDPRGVYANSRVADVFAGTSNLNVSGVAWSGFITAAPQNMSLTFTPQTKGMICARVCVAKPSATVYVDPQIAVGSGPSISRSYNVTGGCINETSAGGGGGTTINIFPIFD